MLVLLYSGVVLCLSNVLSPSLHSLNGSIPDNVEVRDNLLLFKGAVTYDLAGTYLCDATNSIGTRSAAVEVNVTGKEPASFQTAP